MRELLTLPKMLEVVQDQSISPAARNAIKQFLTSVGWQEGKTIDKQGKNLNEQFGYARGYFSLFLASLSDTYGHIYKTKHGEIDLQDVLKNRRILCTLIPSVEKTNQETENIGQINLSGLKNALVSCIGDKVMGTVEDVLDSLPIDLRVPFLSVTDEHAAIQTKGYEIFMTQGRGFGVGAIIGTQDRAGLYKADEFCAQQIEANAKVKSIGTMDDPKKTWELARELAGESQVMQTSGSFVDKNQTTSISYEDQRQTQVTQASRVDIRDFQEQIEGEFHLFFRGKIVRARSFFVNPPLKKNQQLRINDMLPVAKPQKQRISLQLGKIKKGAHTLAKMINSQKQDLSDLAMSLPVKNLKQVFDNPGGLPKNDIAICAFKHWIHGEDVVIDAFNEQCEEVAKNQKAEPPPVQTPAPTPEREPKQKQRPDAFQFAPGIFKKRLEETDTSQDPTDSSEQHEQAVEKPFSADPDKKLYQGFKTIMEGTASLFNDQAETVQNFKKDWTKMEKLYGASPIQAIKRSEEAVSNIVEASLENYPNTPPPEKPGIDAEQQMSDYMNTFLNEVSLK
ncbi:MAG: TraM recognition domain-containing protein [Desulfobacteraceae bacterium]|nr:TraM recognition domain-containing protein [Desulfobacteraceae bacterium]